MCLAGVVISPAFCPRLPAFQPAWTPIGLPLGGGGGGHRIKLLGNCLSIFSVERDLFLFEQLRMRP